MIGVLARRLWPGLAAVILAALAPAAAPTLALAAPVDLARLLDEAPAETLDAYGLFKDAAAAEPNDGVIPYALNTPLFSDYATKTRHVFVPSGQAAEYRADGVLSFPVGTALIKTFAYPADLRDPASPVRKIETRLLIRKAAGWVALPYVWNADGTRATLKRAGMRLPVSWIDGQGRTRALDYLVPNVNQCKGCHALDGALTPIGPKARNLNGDFAYREGTGNQLAHWARAGILAGAPDPALAPRVPRVEDQADGTPDSRGRAYLDVNCGHCHNPHGPASNSGLFLTYDEPDPVARGIGKRPVAAGPASGGLLYDIAPGAPDQSILLRRMASTEPVVAMPQLGRALVHEEGVALIRAYIASMDSR